MNHASKQLYDRWARIASSSGAELALVDTASGRRWTFAEMFSAVEAEARMDSVIVFPQGNGPEFVFSLLRAWRSGTVVSPIELGQTPPKILQPPKWAAHLKMTSASTGAAKCVAFQPEQLAADARNIVSTMGLRRDRANLAVISLAHSYGFSNLVLPLVLHGIPLVLASAPLPEVVLRAAREFPEITIPAVPALWRNWFEGGSIPGNVRLAISAGAPLPLDLERQVLERYGVKIHNFYGSTECGGIAYDRSEIPRTDSALAGTALDNVGLSVDSGGALVVEGEAVGETYWPEASEVLGKGRFVTSDLAELVNGKVLLRGRVSDLINVAGRKVAPEQIEAVLRRHPLVSECVVFGVPNTAHERFETIVAAIKASGPIRLHELNGFLSTELPAWQIPREWWFCSELVVNARGKIPRGEWRRRFLEQKGVQ